MGVRSVAGCLVLSSTRAIFPVARRIALIEEYARHTGHADLIRESIDGLVGQDAHQ